MINYVFGWFNLPAQINKIFAEQEAKIAALEARIEELENA